MFRIATALTALAALATAAPAPQSSRGLTSGSLTWYTEGIGSAFTACGTMNTLTDVGHPVSTPSFEPLSPMELRVSISHPENLTWKVPSTWANLRHVCSTSPPSQKPTTVSTPTPTTARSAARRSASTGPTETRSWPRSPTAAPAVPLATSTSHLSCSLSLATPRTSAVSPSLGTSSKLKWLLENSQ